MAQWQAQSINALLLKNGKVDVMSGFFIEETAEYYPFLKGKAERWKK